MTTRRLIPSRAARVAKPALLSLATMGAVGCLDRPIAPLDPRTTSTIIEKLTQSSVDKIDILLAIDNSRSMADKQEVLAAAVPDLIRGLVNPLCVSPETGLPDATQPASPLEDCQVPTSKREFDPVVDIHIGIVSSSLGGLQNGCDTSKPNNNKVGLNDRGRLLSRLDKDGTSAAETYLDKGFLAWDPTQEKLPKLDGAGNEVPGQFEPGEADLDSDSGKDANSTALIPTLTDMVKGVSQFGCGYEATLEASYRFLNDPNPPANIVLEGNSAVAQGVDDVLLAQRRDFLRPDSLLAVIALSDENDCSIRSTGQFFIAGKTDASYHLPPGRSACATNPNDECCFSCGQADSANCTPKASDPACTAPDPADADVRDSINLRCFDQKRRFGIDFLYPIDRYTQGFTSVTITAADGSQVPNPIFTDLNPNDSNSNVRDPGLVFFAGIVGVPWQDIARDPNDLTKGLKNADELSVPTADGYTGWDLILGDPKNYVDPKDPLMKETFEKRTGTQPITNEPVVDETNFQGNSVNGNEYPIPNRDDLQYACIFQLPQERDCTNPANNQGCDCPLTATPDDQTSKPLCNPDPAQDHKQTHAKAYPGTRFLSAIRSLGAQGIVGSVCPKQLTNPDARDYGYRPAIQAIIDRLKTALGGQCLPRTLSPDASGQVACLIIEGRNTSGQCTCDIPGRTAVPAESAAAIEQAKKDPSAAGADCFCAVTQLTGDELTACQTDEADNPVVNGAQIDGWCYVDATTTPPVGNPAIVAGCPDTERRLIRFVGEGEAAGGATLFITCSGDS